MRLLLALMMAALVAGCDSGTQQGRFTVSGSRGGKLENDAGWITKLIGTPFEAPTANDELLMAVIWLGGQFNSHGSSTSHQTFVSTHEISTASGKLTIEWDRRTDSVSVCDDDFDLNRGNVFVTRMVDSKPTVQQANERMKQISNTAIIEAVRKSWPDDPEIQALVAHAD